MSARFKPLPQLQGEQALASDPSVHASLSASAGTGKTQVLTARVLRLLLQGARPESILCLTFTKAAAAEMANRIGRQLAAWVKLPEKVLRKELFALSERDDPLQMERARQLFARVLDAPGGLKIQTIHSFAQSLLASFPAEAEIVPGFTPIEGRAEQELVRQTLADLISSAEGNGNRQLIEDIQALSRRLGEVGAVQYLQACACRDEALARLGPPTATESAVRQLMQLPEGDAERIIAARCADGSFDCALLERLLEANRHWNTDSGARICSNIEAWLAANAEGRAASLAQLADRLVTKDFRPKISPKQVAVCADYGDLVAQLAAFLAEVEELRRKSGLAAAMTAALRAGQAFAAAYARAKRSAGVADFNDLIAWSRRLLAEPGMGDWVRYKLDRQIDHILIDEAQDTNAAQWDIVQRLVEEYFSGSSEAEQRWRTVFIVGDFKQAIYSFQGSDPGAFVTAVREFRGRADELRAAQDPLEQRDQLAREFRELSIAASFRSAPAILEVVDAAIAQLGFRAMGLDVPPPAHRAHHDTRPGIVELWHPFSIEDIEEDEGEGEERWVELRDRLYAEALAKRIKQLLDERPILASTGRELAPGDILVLVRSRRELASLLVARLFAKQVPVAGLDRLHLHEPLAVQDLLAAIKFAVQPNDDLNLASLLVSPLVGLDQDALFVLAHDRPASLWSALRQCSAEREDFQKAEAALRELLTMADFTTPSRFLETIFSGPMQGRRKLYGRLGAASRDPIDELMNSALEFERSEVPLLDRFLAWFSRGDVEVQRDPAAPGNEVRVLTVHGAKGLEAPVVILADATADPKRLGRAPVSVDLEIRGIGKAPLLRPRKEERYEPFDSVLTLEEQRALEEHWRLLYVALTRASDRLIVAGVAPKRERPENCWHRAVEQALIAVGAEAVDGDWGTSLVHRSGSPTFSRAPRAPKAPARSFDLPAWARAAAPPEARPPRPLAPSSIGEDRLPAEPPTPAMRAAARRGTIIHQLLERLPDVLPEQRRTAALRWLERSAGVGNPEEREELAATVCGILSDPLYERLFGPSSLAEAPIAATLADGRVIAGTVDRLLVEANMVSVIDFKTGRVPAAAGQIPAYHQAQMRAYQAALSVIFPKREVRASLLYTAGPTLYEIGG